MADKTLYQRMIEEVRKYIPMAYIAKADEVMQAIREMADDRG